MKTRVYFLLLIISIFFVTGHSLAGLYKREVPASSKEDAGKPIEEIDFITTDNYANRRLEFYYYIPTEIMENKHENHPVLVCVIPGLSRKSKNGLIQTLDYFAETEGFLLLVPFFVFDQDNWSSQKSYQYPSVWSGDALIKIIDKVKGKYELQLSKLYFYGLSAGAQFGLRFSLWRPELCAACSAHGSGGMIIPQTYVDVKFHVSVGREDVTRIPKAEAFYNHARGLGIDVIYKQYQGDHSFTPGTQLQDSLKFFKEVKGSD